MVLAQVRQEVRLGDRHDAGADAEQPQHVEVLGRLRHRALVGGDAEHGDVDAAGRRHHRAQEPLVARHVDHPGLPDPGQGEMSVASLEGDAAPLLLGQPVGVDAGERLDQRGLAVVDVARGADDDAEGGGRGHSTSQVRPGASFLRSKTGSPRRIATGAAQ